MANVTFLTFNLFQENTYIVYDETGECIIFDPGCSDEYEKNKLLDTLKKLDLKPVRLLNTHCHIDHILGNRFVADTFNLPLEIHQGELGMLERGPTVAAMYGIPYLEHSPVPSHFLKEDDEIIFGNSKLKIIFTPGHSPASLSFYCEKDHFLIAGDVLFKESIGRTDLPGCNHKLLLEAIREKLFMLPDETIVWPGHGEYTTIGYEKKHNPFVGMN
jgi:glyoxylase-like metal-dependent hydrolase (beta-lactamase superfamily II)